MGPLFPDILASSSVMGEGIDLHRFRRHAIHHDGFWNPSTLNNRRVASTVSVPRPKSTVVGFTFANRSLQGVPTRRCLDLQFLNLGE